LENQKKATASLVFGVSSTAFALAVAAFATPAGLAVMVVLVILAGAGFIAAILLGFQGRRSLKSQHAIAGITIGILGVAALGALSPLYLGRAKIGPIHRLESKGLLSQACRGKGIEAATAYAEGQGPHAIALADSEGNVHEWNGTLPNSWLPKSAEGVQLVGCVQSGRDLLGECSSTGNSVAKQYRLWVNIDLVKARSGALVASVRLYGGNPPDCPTAESGGTGGTVLEGSPVPFEWVEHWLEEYVDP
jgi:hypothetical protein